MADDITYPMKQGDFIVFPPGIRGTVTAICRRPNMYVRDRESFLTLIWGITIGSNDGLLVPGPDFSTFQVDMDQPMTQEWTNSIRDYVFPFLPKGVDDV